MLAHILLKNTFVTILWCIVHIYFHIVLHYALTENPLLFR